MSLISDTNFLLRISGRLERFKATGNNTWNCRCPICGDSQKDARKARGYFYVSQSGDSLSYKCWNCGYSSSLSYFVKRVAPESYQQYLYERLGTKRLARSSLDPVPKPKAEDHSVQEAEFYDTSVTGVTAIRDLPKNHPVIEYLNSRQLPMEKCKNFGYTNGFMTFVNALIPDKFNENLLSSDYPALIIPLINRDKKVFGFQGRNLGQNKAPRYITILLNDEQRLFGGDTVDESRKFYVVEGPLDSLFLDNSIALCGSDSLRINSPNAVHVLDCEPRNKQIVGKIAKLIKAGFKVCLLPAEHFSGMDINDMILEGYSADEIQDLIDMHTYQGLVATVNFNKWRRV